MALSRFPSARLAAPALAAALLSPPAPAAAEGFAAFERFAPFDEGSERVEGLALSVNARGAWLTLEADPRRSRIRILGTAWPARGGVSARLTLHCVAEAGRGAARASAPVWPFASLWVEMHPRSRDVPTVQGAPLRAAFTALTRGALRVVRLRARMAGAPPAPAALLIPQLDWSVPRPSMEVPMEDFEVTRAAAAASSGRLALHLDGEREEEQTALRLSFKVSPEQRRFAARMIEHCPERPPGPTF